MVYIFVTTGNNPVVTLVKADTPDRRRELSGVKDDDYVVKQLTDFDLDCLKNNSEVLIR